VTRGGILVVNAGSSSIKFLLFAEQGAAKGAEKGAEKGAHRGRGLELAFRGQLEAIDTAPHFVARGSGGEVLAERHWGDGVALGHDGAIDHIAGFVRAHVDGFELAAVGHRVAHGGPQFLQPVRIDPGVLAALQRFVPLAPLHQPHNLMPIARLLQRRPDVPQVACFDTAFHATTPEVEQRFALPDELHRAGVRRYGFHGLSYEYIASVLPAHDARAAAGRTVVCHLGNGASMCAMRVGSSVATTMGFTAVDGLPMGTRSGSIDPGVLLWLMDERGMDARAIEHLLYHESGLLGVSGVASDMRRLLASDAPRARLAIDLFVYRIGRELGALASTLGGLDALVFTAGIGENSPAIRAGVCRGASWLGVALDETANERSGPRISTAASRVAVWVLPTDEERMIALHTQRLLAAGGGR
jgi:acetate kinase